MKLIDVCKAVVVPKGTHRVKSAYTHPRSITLFEDTIFIREGITECFVNLQTIEEVYSGRLQRFLVYPNSNIISPLIDCLPWKRYD